jgi:hypothetical protein
LVDFAPSVERCHSKIRIGAQISKPDMSKWNRTIRGLRQKNSQEKRVCEPEAVADFDVCGAVMMQAFH